MLRVDDLSELLASNFLFKHPHVHRAVKFVQPGCIATHYLGNSRAPVGGGEKWQQSG